MTRNGLDRREQVLALVRSREVSAHFQPIVDLHDGLIVAYEALTRVDPAAGFEHTGELFEAAAAENLLWELESITRRTALAAAANWPAHMRLFVNCTPAVFADPRFSAQLADDMAQSPDLVPNRIVLEITELSDDQHIPGLVEQVRAATAAGFNVALDDAGAGASGLNRMMSLRPQWVKLDREFVRGIDSDLLRQNLVKFFVHFARMSGVSVIAEGIESATELQTVTSLGVRFAQGYYLGRPGTRAQTMDPAFVSEVRARWASVEASVPQEMLEPTLAAICRPALSFNAGQPISDAHAGLTLRPDAVGVVILDDSRPIGWLSAPVVRSAAPRDTLKSLESSYLPVVPLPGGLSVSEAVSSLCARDDDRIPDPIVVTSGETVLGTVRVRDLLRVASTDGQLVAAGRARLTGLPTRVRADQHLAALIKQSAPGSDVRNATDTPQDAAFVDIRRFAEFNTLHGSARGDVLIRELAELVSSVVIAGLDDTFVAHLGDDRFVLTARPGELEPRLQRLAAGFDELQAEESSPAAACPALRILLLPRVFAYARHPRDIYRIEQRMREQARDRDSGAKQGGSYVLIYRPETEARKAA